MNKMIILVLMIPFALKANEENKEETTLALFAKRLPARTSLKSQLLAYHAANYDEKQIHALAIPQELKESIAVLQAGFKALEKNKTTGKNPVVPLVRHLGLTQAFLFQQHHNPDISKFVKSFIHHAVREDCLDTISYFFEENNVSIDIRLGDETVLYWAILKGSASTVQWLLEHKASPNIKQNNISRTALHLCIKPVFISDRTKKKELLRKHGALSSVAEH